MPAPPPPQLLRANCKDAWPAVGAMRVYAHFALSYAERRKRHRLHDHGDQKGPFVCVSVCVCVCVCFSSPLRREVNADGSRGRRSSPSHNDHTAKHTLLRSLSKQSARLNTTARSPKASPSSQSVSMKFCGYDIVVQVAKDSSSQRDMLKCCPAALPSKRPHSLQASSTTIASVRPISLWPSGENLP